MKLRVEGEWSDVVAAIDAGEPEQALELLLERLTGADELEQAARAAARPRDRAPARTALPAPARHRPLLRADSSGAR